MSTVNQKEYLKRYLGIGKGSGGRKKKKQSKIKSTGLKIVDDDIDVRLNEEIQEDLNGDNEDAPQIVSVIDDRPPSLRIDEKTKVKLWVPLGETDETSLNVSTVKFEGNIKLSKSTGKKDSNKQKIKTERKDSNDYSPPRHRVHSQSSPRSEKSSSDSIKIKKEAETPERDFSPVRKHGRDEDSSPPRINRKHSDSDSSPVRRSDVKKNLSPNRKRDCTKDFSPVRRKKYNTKSEDDVSPLRRRKTYNDIDISPRRKFKVPDRDSPSRKKTNTALSPLRINNDLSPPRRKGKSDDDNSPPRRSKVLNRDSSPPRRRNVQDFSPPRRKKEGNLMSPSRKMRKHDDNSPVRKSKISTRKTSPPGQRKSKDFSPPRRKKSRWDENEETDYKLKKTLDGKMAGLQNAVELMKETEELKKKEDEMFKNMDAEISGANAATVVRKKKTEIDPEEEDRKRKKEEEKKEKYDRWGKGLKQVENANEKLQNDLYEMSKPLARYADDADLEQYLKEQERDGDPMLQYIRQKKRKNAIEAGIPMKQQYAGDSAPNRFAIRPGYRWDGVDRSNGYEKKWFEVQNSRTASMEESYKWSTEDM